MHASPLARVLARHDPVRHALQQHHGYSYAGLARPLAGRGIAATLALKTQKPGGHFAVWTGVAGRRGWLQGGLKQEPYDLRPHLYVEDKVGGREREFHDLGEYLKPARVVVSKMPGGWVAETPLGRFGPYRVNAQAASVLAEALDASIGKASARGVRIADARGVWRPLRRVRTEPLRDPGWQVRRLPGGFNARFS